MADQQQSSELIESARLRIQRKGDTLSLFGVLHDITSLEMLAEHRSPIVKIDLSGLLNITVVGFLRMISEVSEDASRVVLLNIPKSIYETIRIACGVQSNVEVSSFEVEVFSKDAPNDSMTSRVMTVKEITDLGAKNGGIAVLGDGNMILGSVARLSPRMFNMNTPPAMKFANEWYKKNASEITFWLGYVEFLNHTLQVAANFASSIYFSWLEMRHNSVFRVNAAISSLTMLGESSDETPLAIMTSMFGMAENLQGGIVAQLDALKFKISNVQRALQSHSRVATVDEPEVKAELSKLFSECEVFEVLATEFSHVYNTSADFLRLDGHVLAIKERLVGAMLMCQDVSKLDFIKELFVVDLLSDMTTAEELTPEVSRELELCFTEVQYSLALRESLVAISDLLSRRYRELHGLHKKIDQYFKGDTKALSEIIANISADSALLVEERDAFQFFHLVSPEQISA